METIWILLTALRFHAGFGHDAEIMRRNAAARARAGARSRSVPARVRDAGGPRERAVLPVPVRSGE